MVARDTKFLSISNVLETRLPQRLFLLKTENIPISVLQNFCIMRIIYTKRHTFECIIYIKSDTDSPSS